MPKQSIRQRLLLQRKSLQSDQLTALGLAAQERMLSLDAFAAAAVVALYAPVHHEVATELLLSVACAAGKTVLFPAVASGCLEFRRVAGPGNLVPGAFGIAEPAADCTVYQPEDVDLFVVPGVAFDLMCRRVGYGKGYYDRALHTLEGSGRLAGFCYDFQILDEIPVSSHDVLMDMVITDRRVLRTTGQFT